MEDLDDMIIISIYNMIIADNKPSLGREGGSVLMFVQLFDNFIASLHKVYIEEYGLMQSVNTLA